MFIPPALNYTRPWRHICNCFGRRLRSRTIHKDSHDMKCWKYAVLFKNTLEISLASHILNLHTEVSFRMHFVQLCRFPKWGSPTIDRPVWRMRAFPPHRTLPRPAKPPGFRAHKWYDKLRMLLKQSFHWMYDFSFDISREYLWPWKLGWLGRSVQPVRFNVYRDFEK